MLRYGQHPWLECSTHGEKRLSAFFARPRSLEGRSIEEAYQAAKIFADGTTNLGWKEAKGKKAVNQAEVNAFYEKWWREYMDENPELKVIVRNARGIQDKFGQRGHTCQASVLWKLRGEMISADDFKPIKPVNPFDGF
jgi:hypothetical protein